MIEKTKLPHISQFLLCEIIARSSSKIFSKFTTHLIIETGRLQPRLDLVDYGEHEFRQKRLKLMEEFEEDLSGIALKIINLTVSLTAEAMDFWNRMIRPQVCYEYGYVIQESFKKDEIPMGMLCAACFYHFGMSMADNTYIQRKDRETFHLMDFEGFTMKTQGYSLKKHKIYSLADSYSRMNVNDHGSNALRVLTLKTELADWLGKESELTACIIDQADIQLQVKDYDGCSQTCNRAFKKLGSKNPDSCRVLLIMLKLAIQKKSTLSSVEDLFSMVSSLIFYNFGEYHPLHSTVRTLMA